MAVPTGKVFAALAAPALTLPAQPDDFIAINTDAASLLSIPNARRNDLEIPAIRIQAIIADVLTALQDFPNCLLARMSGSGATCFALYENTAEAQRAASKIRLEHPSWWVHAGTLS